MAHGSPDWVRQVQVVLVAAQPSDERAAGDGGRYSGSDTSYQTVASWTVATGYRGELKEIIFYTDEWGATTWKITIGSVTFETDWVVQSSLPLIFEDLRLAAADVVKVEAKSDGTAIVADAVIAGREIVV